MPRRWAGFLLLWVLTGCATPSGKLRPFSERVPRSSNSAPRILLAASDSPPASGEPSKPSVQGYTVPGRNLDSQAPWEFFLGNAAHRLITYMYRVNHPGSIAYFNTKSVVSILQDARLGEPSRLLPHERNLCPDITDLTTWRVFEIKPWNARGLEEGRLEIQNYLSALNRAVEPEALFIGGTGFQGQILVRFAQGQHI